MKMMWGIAAGLVTVAGVSSVAFWSALAWSRPPGPEVRTGLAESVSEQVRPERMTDVAARSDAFETTVGPARTAAPEPEDEAAAPVQPPLSAPWTATIAAGDTLDSLLLQAGLGAAARVEIALAIAAEFDVAQLRPGHRLSVQSSSDGSPVSVELEIDDGVRILVRVAEEVDARTLLPAVELVSLASEIAVNGSIFASLRAEGAPTRFAVDLAEMLVGTVDFRRDLRGGETLRLLWQEKRRKDGSLIGEPKLTYAVLGIGGARFEIVWPGEGGEAANVYMNGEVVRTFAPPVIGARLSSSFGNRRHPIYGDVRMHTGVDFAAARATPVFATAPGRVAFIGRRSGYGRVVEIAHGSGTMTRYAHLSAFAGGIKAGDRVNAGDRIGAVGSSGLATGPNLHYEVRLDGLAVDPMEQDGWAELAENAGDALSEQQLLEARARLASLLRGDLAGNRLITTSTKESIL